MRRPLEIGVDPLMVAGRFGELIDPFLRDFEPVGEGNLPSDELTQLLRVIEFSGRHG